MPHLSDHEAELLKLKSRSSVNPIMRSNVIEITLRAHDSPWRQRFLHRLLDVYLALHARASHDPEAEGFFEAQARLLRDKLHSSEDAFRGAEVQTGIMSLAEHAL